MSGADQVPQDGEAADDDEGLPSEDETSAELSDRQYPAPSQRQWIHPAELPSTRAVTAPPMAPRRWVTAPLGIAASVMLIAGIALLVIHPKAGSHPATTAVAIGSSPDGATAARIASHSLVTITDGPTHSILGDGMTLSPATMIATTAPVHKGAIVELTSSTGAHTSAHVVGQDPVTGVSVVAADHAISTTTSIGSLPSSTTPVVDVALTAPSSGTTPNVVWMGATAATATSTSTSAPTGLPVGVLQSSAALEGPPGDVLLDGAGQAIALEAPKLGTHDYLPAGLVAELATQLEHGGTVSHARLGITGKSAPTPGATVVSVDHSGPAAGVLVPGDTITAMDHMTVASMPDLLDCLYRYAAKSVVEVDFVHNGTPEVATLTLGSAP